MGRLVGIVLPLALGAAVSPTLLAVQLVNLSRKTAPTARAWACAAGCAVVLIGLSVMAVLIARSTGGSHSPSEAGALVKLAAAALLALLGVRNLRRPQRPPQPERTGLHPRGQAFVLGLGLMLTNFSTIALFLPAVHAIGISGVPLVGKTVTFAALYAITLLPVVGPPLVVLLLGARATPLLRKLNRSFAKHRRAIGAGLCFGFAALLGAAGLSALL